MTNPLPEPQEPPLAEGAARSRRRRLGLVALLVVSSAALLAPSLVWWHRPWRDLRITIIDKTVPEPSRREHAGFVWVLNHLKLSKPGGETYRADRDYYGFFPLPEHKWEAREPSIAKAAPEFLYLADTYGVYSEEWHGKAFGNRSPIIYGSLRNEEVRDIEEALPGCLTLVGEFNTFANPTWGDARQTCLDWFGLRWNGWTARFFRDLERRGEVPPWAVRNYEAQTGLEWAFEGPGFLFVNEDDRVEVLQEGEDVEKGRGLRLLGRPEGIRDLDLPRDTRFDYWVDLVQPRPGVAVMADFDFPLLPEGEKKLKALGLARRYPAVLVGARGRTRTVYMAGDFVDAWPTPDFLRFAGLPTVRRTFSREVAGDPQSFYWQAYVPMMSRILEETLERKHSGR